MGVLRRVGVIMVMRGIGRVRRAQWRGIRVRFLSAMLGVLMGVAGGEASAQAGAALRPLDFHATVLNGGTIGSAFMIADGIAVTNAHVVNGLKAGGSVTLVASGGGERRTLAKIIGVSPRMDLAVLQLPRDFKPKVSGADAEAHRGLAVVAAGIDAGSGAAGRKFAVTGAVITPSLSIPAFGHGLVVSMPGVRPGFSGGPLLDMQGRLVGMVTAIRPGGAGAAQAAASRRVTAGATEAFALDARTVRREVARMVQAAGRQ